MVFVVVMVRGEKVIFIVNGVRFAAALNRLERKHVQHKLLPVSEKVS